MANSGKLVKLAITAYTDNLFKNQVGEPFSVGINPDKYTHSHSVSYDKAQAPGQSGASPKFTNVLPETINFEIVFDGTGVTDGAGVIAPSKPKGTVAQQIRAFKKIAYSYQGKIHAPNFLTLKWGSMYFKCRLTSLTINYTLFTPNGVPLRAKVSCSFQEYLDPKTVALAANDQSADLTHGRIVIAGDTLPYLCFKIYGNSKYYLEVAQQNGLADFRNLEPGQTIYFPPLV